MLLVLSDSWTLAASTVRLLQLEGREESHMPLPAVFGNQEEALDLEIMDASAQAGTLSADLFQVSGNLTMPLIKNLHLRDAVVLTGASLQSLHISLKLPEVRQRAEILVRFSLVQSTSSSSPTSLGDLRFEVFPVSVTRELTDLLQPRVGGAGPVVLFGAGRKLHRFLAGLRVPFEDGGNEVPEHFDPNRLYLGELNSEESFQPTEEIKKMECTWQSFRPMKPCPQASTPPFQEPSGDF